MYLTAYWHVKFNVPEPKALISHSPVPYDLPGFTVALIGSVQFSCSVVSDSLQPHGLQHARLTCPPPTPRVYSNSFPLSRWCHPTISSSVIPFSSCLQSCPASGSFPMSQFFASGGQSTGVSASAPVLPMNIQDWFLLGPTSLISLLSMGYYNIILLYRTWGVRRSEIWSVWKTAAPQHVPAVHRGAGPFQDPEGPGLGRSVRPETVTRPPLTFPPGLAFLRTQVHRE